MILVSRDCTALNNSLYFQKSLCWAAKHCTLIMASHVKQKHTLHATAGVIGVSKVDQSAVGTPQLKSCEGKHLNSWRAPSRQ